MKALFIILFLSSCSQNQISVVAGKDNKTISTNNLTLIHNEFVSRFPGYKEYVESNGLTIYFYPYANDGKFGYYIPSVPKIHISYRDECTANQTTIHELLHLVAFIYRIPFTNPHANKHFFEAPDSLEFIIHKKLFNCKTNYNYGD